MVRRHGKQVHFYLAMGFGESDIAQVFHAVLVTAQSPLVHGWN
jgi:hypothetical protein